MFLCFFIHKLMFLTSVLKNNNLNSESDVAKLQQTVDLFKSQPVVVVFCR